MSFWYLNCKKRRISICLTKAVPQKTSNAKFNMGKFNRYWTCQLQVILLSAERNCVRTLSKPLRMDSEKMKTKYVVPHRCFIKKLFLKTSQNSQINTRSSHPEVFCQKLFLKILQNSLKNIFVGVAFIIKLQAGNLKPSETASVDGI